MNVYMRLYSALKEWSVFQEVLLDRRVNIQSVQGPPPLGLAKNSFGTFISQMIAQSLQFVLGVMTARLLGAEGKGLFHILIIWLGIYTALGSLGLGQASIYFIGKDRKCLPMALSNLLVTTVVISVVLGTAGWFVLQSGQKNIYFQFPLWIWAVVAILIPIHLLQSSLMQVLSAMLRIREINTVEVIRVTIQLLLFLLFVGVIGADLKGAFVAYAVSTFFAAAGFFLLVLYYGERPGWPDWSLMTASLRYGIKAYLFNLLRLLNVRLDALLVAALAVRGVQAAGVYSVATNLAELLLFIPTSIRLSLFPMVSAGSTEEANRLTTAACRHTIFLTTILAVALGGVGALAVRPIYGQAFTSAVIPLLILLPGIVMLSQATILYGDLLGRGQPQATLISIVISLIVTLVLDLILIPKYGIIGAALASSTAYTIEFLVAGVFFVRNSGVTWRQILIFQRSDLRCYLDILPKIQKMVVST
jgi:O-antigen/teichoic acid export membrane protein